MSRFDRVSLIQFCDNKSIVLDSIPDKCNRKTRVSGQCLTENCDCRFEKNLVQILDTSGPYCKECSTKRRMEKTAKTNLKKYGAKCSFQNEDVRNKYKENMMKKNGVENPSHIPSVVVKRKETTMTNLGVGCSFQSEEVKKKIKETNLERYNAENPAQNSDVRQKMKDTCLERYDVEYPLQNSDVRQKMKDTCLERYDVESPFQNEDVKQKIRATMLERYNVENPMKSEVIKEKVKKTNLERYDCEWGLQNEDVKQKSEVTCIKKYGGRKPLQNAEILERALKSGYKRKLFLTPSDEEWYLQGYEPLVAPRLIEQYQEENITSDIKIVPAVQWTDSIGKTHVYRCDFYVESLKLIIEVKSTWTAQKDEEKIKKCMDYWSNQGNTYRLIISDNKGNYLYDRTNHDILSIPFDWHKSP